MRKLLIISSVFLLSLLLISCGENVDPIENPEDELFSVLAVLRNHQNKEYAIYERTNIPEMGLYTTPAISVGQAGETCTISGFHKYNYMIRYNGEFYDIAEADDLNLYSCKALESVGVIKSNDE